VLSVLIENDLLPKVIAGSSSGSLIAVLIGSHSKEELKEHINQEFR
jgi:NTE family protein